MSTGTDDQVWLRHYQQDLWTLEEVAELENITREGVRQRLIKLGIKSRSMQETHRLRELRDAALHADAIRMSFLKWRDISKTADECGLAVPLVKRALPDLVPEFEVLTRIPRNVSKRYLSEELVASLREAAASTQGNLSAGKYEGYVKENPTLPDGRARPGKQVVMLRFGSWRAALDTAGLPANPHAGPEKSFTEADAISAVVKCWKENGAPPSAAFYDAWQRNRPGEPSGATVRNLVGGWNQLVIRAWQLVHGITLDQDDIDVAVPDSLIPTWNEREEGGDLAPYQPAVEDAAVSLPSNLVTAEYNSLERAVRSHALIQNAVASAGAVAGFTPHSPAAGSPLFDVLLTKVDQTFVVEVKSATPENLELQLRIGLGQVLKYSHELNRLGIVALPVLAVELHPDESWCELLANLGIGLLVRGSIQSDLFKLVKRAP